jgi:hypothetical protein
MPVDAQIRASELASVSQTVDGTVITLEYYRPSLRGRTPFGGVVRWGEIWTPGANWATTLEVSKDVHLNTHPLPKGKYSVWMIPQERGEWTVIVHKEARRFHTMRPRDTTSDQLRFTVRTEQGPSMETLSWSFPVVQSDGAGLRLHWGTTMVSMRVRVEPTKPQRLAGGERSMYVGRYRMPSINVRDTVTRLIEIIETPDGIRGRMTPPLIPAVDPEFDLLPVAQHRFRMAVRRNGEYFDAEEVYFLFTVRGGRAENFEVPNIVTGAVMAKGERIP